MFRIFIFLVCFQFTLGGASQTAHDNEEIVANAFYSILALDKSINKEFVFAASKVKEIYEVPNDMDTNEQMIRILKFEQSLLHGEGKPIIGFNQVFEAKAKYPAKDITALRNRMLYYMLHVVNGRRE